VKFLINLIALFLFEVFAVIECLCGLLAVSGTVGPMARDVDSLVTMMRVMTSPDMFQLDPSLPVIPFQEEVCSST
jgi:fatty acid amide hydrolase